MKSWIPLALMFALALVPVVGCKKAGGAAAPKAASGAPTAGTATSSHDIMERLNARGSGLHTTVGQALKADAIDWATIEPQAKEYATLAEALVRHDPPRGEKSSWEALCKTYSDDAKALAAAAEKKDKDAALTAHGSLNSSCMDCHREHKPQRGGGKGKGKRGPG